MKAEITKVTKTVMKPVEVEEKQITLTITPEEAALLHTVFGNSSGPASVSIYRQLNSLIPYGYDVFTSVIDTKDIVSKTGFNKLVDEFKKLIED